MASPPDAVKAIVDTFVALYKQDLSASEIHEATMEALQQLDTTVRGDGGQGRRGSTGDDPAAQDSAPDKPAARRTRAKEVFGGDDEADDVGTFDLSSLTKYTKSESVMRTIIKAMNDNTFFAEVDNEQKTDIMLVMEGVHVKKGDVVFKAGEVGDFFYVIQSGQVELLMGGDEMPDLNIQIEAGGSFGELALLYTDPRAATIRASEETELWRVHGKTFKQVVVESSAKKRKQYEQLLSAVPLLSTLKNSERAKIADTLEEKTYEAGEVLIRENDRGDFFYVLMSGEVDFSKADHHMEVVMTMSEGDYFGELALLTDSQRRATATAKTSVKVARMHRRDFTRLLGPLQDIMTFRKYDGVSGEDTPVSSGSGTATPVSAGPEKTMVGRRRASVVAAGGGGLTPQQIEALAGASDMKTIDEDLSVLSPRATEFPADKELSLDDFEFSTTLGLGSFGRVRLCRFKATGKAYAIKIMNKSAVIQMKQLQHIRDEKNILLEINYPFIVNLYGTFQDDVNVYMAFEFVIGGEFFTLLRNEDHLPNDQAVFYGAEICLTLSFLHNLKIIYRDLKPENLLIDREGHLKITDFGFAKVVEDRTWTLCGTPDYIAPEIIRNKGHGKAADWWAFGVLIFEMLAGYPPFYDESGGFGTYKKILKGVLPFPDEFEEDAKDLIRKLLVADIKKRLGNLHKGANDIRDHPFFEGVDWNKVRRREVPVPMVPDIESETDTSYFEEYESDDDEPESITEAEQELFADF